MQTILTHSDQELLRLLAQDNKPAFDAIYERYWAGLYSAAFKQLQDQEQSEDVVQDVFTDLWMRRGAVTIQNLKSYLFSAIRFQVYDLADKRKVSQTFYDSFRQMLSHGFSADTNVAEKELAALFAEWLATLPEKRKEIFILHFVEQLSTIEIANRLNISQKTVQNQLGTATTELRKRIILFFSFMG